MALVQIVVVGGGGIGTDSGGVVEVALVQIVVVGGGGIGTDSGGWWRWHWYR